MKTITALIMSVLFGAACIGADNTREQRLEALKRQFPDHVAGKITQYSDPIIQTAYNDIKSAVMELTVENISTKLPAIERRVNSRLSSGAISRRTANERIDSFFYSGKLTSAQRHANSQNVAWLKQKVVPYLHRLSQFQRGR